MNTLHNQSFFLFCFASLIKSQQQLQGAAGGGMCVALALADFPARHFQYAAASFCVCVCVCVGLAKGNARR